MIRRGSAWWKFTISIRKFDERIASKSFMKLLRPLPLMLCLGLAGASLLATTVIPPTFDQLVRDAELIFQGTVTATQSRWVGEGSDRHIATDVTFRIEDAIKGVAGENYTIEMLGGTINGE